jgi:hypothetical protein
MKSYEGDEEKDKVLFYFKLEFELRASRLLGRRSSSLSHSASPVFFFFVMRFFKIRSLELFAQGWH